MESRVKELSTRTGRLVSIVKLTKSEVLSKLCILRDKRIPVLFSVSLTRPVASASGYGRINEVDENTIAVVGRGSLTILWSDFWTEKGAECELSGHYPLNQAQKAGLDFYFRRVRRFRALTLQSEHGDVHIAFEVGGDRK